MNQTATYPLPTALPKWRRWLVHSPLARIVWFIVAVAVIGLPLVLVLKALGWAGPDAPRLQSIVGGVLAYCIPAPIAYLLLVRLVEKRRPTELARPGWMREVAIGAACGATYISACAAVLWAADAYTVTGLRSDIPFAGNLLVLGVGAAVFEELLFRGVLFRIVEEGLGTWAALVCSALFFGFAHIRNPGASVWSSVAIAIEAGLLLGMAYHVTRSLPLCMGIHAAWNFTQGSVYGSAVSGTKTKNSFLVPQVSGPDWLTGGSFGFEASLVAAGIGLIVSLLLIRVAITRGTIVPWLPRRKAAAYDGSQATAS